MYGIQWDLVCKFLEVKGNWDTSENTAQYYIKENSTSWGNYSDSSITLTRGKYNINPLSLSISWTPFNTDTENYVTNSETLTSNGVLLTTGASEETNKMNIYDFAGNEYEWTLEKTASTYNPCSNRGGYYSRYGSSHPASIRGSYLATSSFYGIGLRVSLY